MFATFRNRNDSLLVERSGPSTNFLACNNCRLKKLKCTGEPKGCRRCILHHIKCEYTETSGRRKAGSSRKKPTNPPPSPPYSDSLEEDPRPSLSIGLRSRRKCIISPSQSRNEPEMSVIESQLRATEVEMNSPSIFNALPEDIDARGSDSEGFLDINNLSGDYLPFDSEFTDIFLQSNQFSGTDMQQSSSSLLSPVSLDVLSPQLTQARPQMMHPPEPLPSLKSRGDAQNTQFSSSPQTARSFSEIGTCFSDTTSYMCGCIHTALALLEALALGGLTSQGFSISQTLRSKKQALQTCNDLLHCQSCSSKSVFMMLLIDICQKAVESYTCVIRVLREQKSEVPHSEQSAYNTKPSNRPRVGSLLGCESPSPELPPLSSSQESDSTSSFLRDYDISTEEQICVLTSLATLQIGKWKAFLGQLSRRCTVLGLKGHLAIISDLERQSQTHMQGISILD